MRALLLAILFAAIGCSKEEAPPAIGAVRIHTSIEHAALFVDAVERGPLTDGMEVQLTPGAHMLEARRDDVMVGRVAVEARSALIYDVEILDVSAPVIAQAPAPPPEPPPPVPPVVLPTEPIEPPTPPTIVPLNEPIAQPSPTPPPPEPAAEGFLRINTMPWSRVYVDGREAGSTPLAAFRVSAGPHTIVLRTENGQTTTLEVTVDPGETEVIVRRL